MALPTSAEVSHALLGLQGIFWALNMLVVHHAADDIAHEQARSDGIEKLIVAACCGGPRVHPDGRQGLTAEMARLA
ncbi:hypothetical protein [Reyranella soli]|uniref:Uncharacterized protein n=1 Tax=Reyranella soli TaxID=1230389 RepID=A0A512NSL2_9HYPH|nr:hypothetical protein [Reyranella soli]GEP61929.1 hypothetical protein RSO01_90950 [Reyranella soli]